jgi:hypothetical protein
LEPVFSRFILDRCDVEYFLDGAVTELGADFKLTLRLIKVETAEVVFTGDCAISKNDVIQTADEMGMAYVSKNGVGIELMLLPLATYFMDNPMSKIEGSPSSVMISGTLNYRANKHSVVWAGFENGTLMVFGDDSVDASLVKNPDISQISNFMSLEYAKMRTMSVPFIGMAYVIPFTSKFNVSLGGSLKMPIIKFEQEYRIKANSGVSQAMPYIQISSWNICLALEPMLKFQYFITPRMALNLSYAFLWQVPINIRRWDYLVNSRLYRPDMELGIAELYNLKPWLDAEGRPNVTDLTGQKITLGIGLYF